MNIIHLSKTNGKRVKGVRADAVSKNLHRVLTSVFSEFHSYNPLVY